MRRLICILLLTFAHAPLFAQWQAVHPASPLHRLFFRAVVPPGSTKCYAVGNDIAVSDDQGKTWQPVYSNTLPLQLQPEQRYTDIDFPRDGIGYMTYQNKIFKTTDGGGHWKTVLALDQTHPRYAINAYFTALFFLDDQEGYAVGDFEKIFHTQDGGTTWDTLRWSNRTAPYISFTDVVFLDANTGFIAGYEVSAIEMNYNFSEFVMKTTDGGKHWNTVTLPTGLDYRSVNLQFLDGDTGFVHLTRSQGNDEAYSTQDGGQSWTLNGPVTELRTVNTLYWIDGKTGLAYGNDYSYKMKLLRTENGGEDWEEISLPVFKEQDVNAITSFAFIDEQNGVAVGSGGNILRTEDKGKTWYSINEAYPAFFTFDFPTSAVGYASAGNGFFKTVDGGRHWSFWEGSDSLKILNMHFRDESNGILYGFKNFYYNVSGGGSKIDPITLPVNFISLSSLVQQDDSLFVCGTAFGPVRNVFIRSGDLGKRWETLTVPGDGLMGHLQRLEGRFYAASTQWIKQGDLRGSSWQTVSSFTTDYIQALLFLSPQVALASFGSGVVMRTADQGLHWDVTGPFPADVDITGFLVANGVVYAYGAKNVSTGREGALWSSSDGGLEWKAEVLPLHVDNGITDMVATAEKIYATGGYGQVFVSALPPPVTHIEEEIAGMVKLYPLPADDQLTVVLPYDQDITDVTLHALNGAIFKRPWQKTSTGMNAVAVSGLAPGLYVVTVHTKEKVYRKRFIKK